MTPGKQQEILQEWRESAPYWEKFASTIRAMFAPVTTALIEEAGIVEGQSVLDVAGGAGEPSIAIAAKVGPDGSVTYTDAVAEMVEAAKHDARRRGIDNVSFRRCSADALPFDDRLFDVAVCRLGVMFFPDPVAGLREMLRVLKPEGTVSLAVWAKAELNPFSYVVTNVVSRHIETPPANSGAPGAFRFAEPGALANILTEAGASDIRERLLKFRIQAPISIDEFWKLRSVTSGTLREKLGSLSAEQANRVARDVKDAVREFFPEGKMSFPAEMIILTGRKR